MPPRPTETDGRLRQADGHFGKGKKLYLEGNADEARAEFDAAIDMLLATPENAADRLKVEAKLEQLVAAIHKFDVNGLGAGDFSQQVAYDKAPLEEILEMTFPVDPGLKPVVKEQLLATSSQIPLELTDPVLSYINYFSSDRGRRTLISGLRRAGRYKPMIQRILQEEQVPQELIYLAQAESGFLPRAVSNKAAVGMWQFIRSRGQEYGLKQTSYSDDRLDPEKSTRSAARHLRDLYNKFGDWYLAIAAYNCGDGCVERAVTRTGYADFWYLRAHNAIPKETTNYVPIIVAMTIMHKNAKAYGIEEIETDAPLLYDSLEVETPTHLALIADASDRPVSEIKDLNPALLTSVAPAHYAIRIPQGTTTIIRAGLESIPAERRASWRIHRVMEGDTIESIAKRYRTPVASITSTNNALEAEIGDVLVIPTSTQIERIAVNAKVDKRKLASVRSKSLAFKNAKLAKRATFKPARRKIASLR